MPNERKNRAKWFELLLADHPSAAGGHDQASKFWTWSTPWA